MSLEFFEVVIKLPVDCCAFSNAPLKKGDIVKLVGTFMSSEPGVVFLFAATNKWYLNDTELKKMLTLKDINEKVDSFLDLIKEFSPFESLATNCLLSIGNRVDDHAAEMLDYRYNRKMADRLRIVNEPIHKAT